MSAKPAATATVTLKAMVPKANPSIATAQQPASATVGGSIADQATVSGGFNPTGMVTFNLYSSATTQDSSTLLFTDTEPLGGGGTATSMGYTTTAPGTDYWLATYNGDTGNNSVTSGATDEPVTIADVPPTVIATSPPNGATNVPVAETPSATFNEAVKPSTVSFTLKDPGGNPVSGSASLSAADTVATFTPDSPLATSTTYTATVSGAQDLSGTPMSAPYSWSFTT
jgi:hypothetical protein